jgi:hypothetical protein
MKRITLTIVIAVLLVCSSAMASEYFVDGGAISGTPGNNSNNCTTKETACLTMSGGLAKMNAAFDHNGADHFLTVRGGTYDTENGLKVVGDSRFTMILSGSSDAHPFTIRAYNPTTPGAPCTTSPPAPGQSVCEQVILIQALIGPRTLDEMQSVNGPGCSGRSCVGAPDVLDCTYYNVGTYNLMANYPGSCVQGSPPHVSLADGGPEGLWFFQDRSAMGDRGSSVNLMGIVDLVGMQDSNPNNETKYVVWDGISIDARGINGSAFRSEQYYDHKLSATHHTWKNGEWKNALGSCMSQPSVASGVNDGRLDPRMKGLSFEYDAIQNPDGTWRSGGTIGNDFLLENFKISHCGVPFDLLRVDGVSYTGPLPKLRDTEYAKFLHAFYLHAGRNRLNNSEISDNAGFAFTADAADNIMTNSYIHDNNGGMDFGGFHQMAENNVFHNNGNADLKAGGVGDGILTDATRDYVRNNTFVWGPRGVYGTAIQLGNGQHGMLIENNLIYGYPRGIEGTPCGIYQPKDAGGNPIGLPWCIYTDRVIIRNNLIETVSPGSEISIAGTDSDPAHPAINPVVLPTCTKGGGVGNMASCNILSPTGGVRLASLTPPNYTLASNSPAVEGAIPNGITTDFLGNTRANGVNGSTGLLPDIGAIEYCDTNKGSCSTAPTTASISVYSGGATSVPITWGGGTCTGDASGHVTLAVLSCNLASTLTFTAPSTASSLNFTTWSGCDSTTGFTCTITGLSFGRVITAAYGATQTLTINSTVASSVPMTASPADAANRSSGSTGFTLAYQGSTLATITAPPSSGGRFFSAWTGCDSTDGALNTACHVAMATDRTISADYSGNGCGVAKSFTVQQVVEICPNQSIFIWDNQNSSGVKLGSHVGGDVGTILQGPASADNNNADWYYVDFATAPDGWLTDINIMLSSGQPPPPTATLLVQSNRVGVSITVSPPDNNGASSGLVNFSRLYGTTVPVTLTAPATQNGDLLAWNGCDSVKATVCTVTVSSGRTVSANYNAVLPVEVRAPSVLLGSGIQRRLQSGGAITVQ